MEILLIVMVIFFIIYRIDLKMTLWAASLVGSKKRWVFIDIPFLILFSG